MQTALGKCGDMGEDVSQPSLRINIVELGGHDQREHDGRPIGAAVGAGEQPRLSTQGQAAQSAFRRVVRQCADACRHLAH